VTPLVLIAVVEVYVDPPADAGVGAKRSGGRAAGVDPFRERRGRSHGDANAARDRSAAAVGDGNRSGVGAATV